MKKIVIAVIVIMSVLSSCKKDEIDTRNMLVGSWSGDITMITNYEEVYTQEMTFLITKKEINNIDNGLSIYIKGLDSVLDFEAYEEDGKITPTTGTQYLSTDIEKEMPMIIHGVFDYTEFTIKVKELIIDVDSENYQFSGKLYKK